MLNFLDFEKEVFSRKSLPEPVFVKPTRNFLFAEYVWALPFGWNLFSTLATASGDSAVWLRCLDDDLEDIYQEKFGQMPRFSIDTNNSEDEYQFFINSWPEPDSKMGSLQLIGTEFGWSSASGKWCAYAHHDFNTCIIQIDQDLQFDRSAIASPSDRRPDLDPVFDIEELLLIIPVEFGVGGHDHVAASEKFSQFEKEFRKNYDCI